MLGTNLLTTLVNPQLDRLGDTNPQLLRELKGRLKRFPMATAIALSLLCQIVIMLGFWGALPGSVMLDDVSLSTYPRLEWSSETQLSPEPVKDLLPADMANRDRAMQSGFVVNRISTPTSASGDKSQGLAALNTIQQGDRLIKIDGQLNIPRGDQLTGLNWQNKLQNLADTIEGKTVKDTYETLTPQQRRRLIGTTVDLELYNAERGYYTATLTRIAVSHYKNSYCVIDVNSPSEGCAVNQDQMSYQIKWPQWHGHVYTCLSLLMVFPLIGVGVFMLANNLADEKRRGTLNFLQLSPKSAFTILSGKLLGVPVCLYLAVGLVVPLQWFTGLNAGYGIGQMLGFYLTLIAQTLIFYLGALLISLSVSNLMVLGLQPWLLAAGVIGFNWLMFNYAVSREFFGNTESHVFLWSVLFSPFSSLAYFNVEQSNVGSNFDLTLGDFQLNFTAYGLLALVHAAGWYALLGHGLERRFSNADNTLLKRRFSYFLTLIFAAFMLGLTGIQVRETYDEPLHLFLMALLSLVYFVMLIMALSPARQTLKDWTRFCHARPPHERLPLWKDLIIGDTSSPVVAIALNLLLLNSLVLTFFCSRFNNFLSSRVDGLVFGCCILMFIGSILFSAVVSQTLLMLPRKKNWVWLGAVGSISCLAFPALSVGMAFAVLEPYPRPTHVLGMPPEVAVLALPLSLLVTVTTVLGFIHTRQLIRSGHSESQQLLSQT